MLLSWVEVRVGLLLLLEALLHAHSHSVHHVTSHRLSLHRLLHRLPLHWLLHLPLQWLLHLALHVGALEHRLHRLLHHASFQWVDVTRVFKLVQNNVHVVLVKTFFFEEIHAAMNQDQDQIKAY